MSIYDSNIYTYIQMYIYTYMYLCICMYTYVHIYIYIYICVYIYIHKHIHVYIYICRVYIEMYKYAYLDIIRIHTYTYTHTHIHVYIYKCHLTCSPSSCVQPSPLNHAKYATERGENHWNTHQWEKNTSNITHPTKKHETNIQNTHTWWRRLIGSLIFIGHYFLQKATYS